MLEINAQPPKAVLWAVQQSYYNILVCIFSPFLGNSITIYHISSIFRRIVLLALLSGGNIVSYFLRTINKITPTSSLAPTTCTCNLYTLIISSITIGISCQYFFLRPTYLLVLLRTASHLLTQDTATAVPPLPLALSISPFFSGSIRTLHSEKCLNISYL